MSIHDMGTERRPIRELTPFELVQFAQSCHVESKLRLTVGAPRATNEFVSKLYDTMQDLAIELARVKQAAP